MAVTSPTMFKISVCLPGAGKTPLVDVAEAPTCVNFSKEVSMTGVRSKNLTGHEAFGSR